ncbi:hypothetical protein KGF56_003637 [Candida oxycetoniae]|uniref:Succinate dehydrogenase [ubiquinone] cytochrome b small subunit n=1 Tax=Candida oxycetoniae TaxID=497107 RepID=A0AAI9WWV5_9ASCO|nr:uncharacterized protein KGF56_003637 [Candida oxycetoniae]KAI3403592.1 hypothetical protein KGF56_003637 [Candida oxycetoniae]
MPFRFPVKFEIPKHVYVNARVLRDQFKRLQFAEHEVTRNALRYIARNEELPSRVRVEAQLQLTSVGIRGSVSGIGILPSRTLRLIPDWSKFKKIEQPPGYIVDTVNDAYKPPLPNSYEGAYHWTYERIIAITMIPLVMTPFVAGVEFPVIDASLSALLIFHCHSGFKSCIIDYIPKRVYGVWYEIASKALTFGTLVAMYGVYVMETTSNGLFDIVKSIWSA